MMNDQLNAARRLLRELADLAEHATLTGTLSDGVGRAIARYNSVLDSLASSGVIATGMFTPLPTNATYGDLGVEARLLAAQLGEGDRGERRQRGESSILLRLAPFVDSSDLSELVREQMRNHADFDMDIVASLAPFLEQHMLGEMIRQHMGKVPGVPSPPHSPKAPEPSRGPEPQPTHMPASAPEAQPATPEDLLELLKNPHLSSEERSELIERLTRSVS